MSLIAPQSKFQEDCLTSDSRIIVMGGAAGCAKSTIGLMRHLRWMDDPQYRGFCIRKNSTAIMKSGGLFDAAVHLYGQVDDIKIKLKEQKIVFSSGGSVSFSHYENDSAGQLYHGLELSNVFYDESSHASESHIWWLISRLRTKAKMNPSIWLSTNPDPDSFLFDWVKWWLYPEEHPNYGLPDPEKNGKVRWIVRKGGVIFWGDSKEEMIVRYGNSSLPVDHPKQVKPLSFQVLLGTIYDNPWIIENQPEYLASLEAMPDVERRRLLLGDWTAREVGSTYFKRETVKVSLTEPMPDEIVKTVRSYDVAGTLKSSSNPSPDYFASCKMSLLKNGDYFIHEIERTRITFGQWLDFILKTAERDGPDVTIDIPEDPNPAAKAATKLLVKDIIEAGYRGISSRTSTSKLDRFRPVAALAENGNITILKDCGQDYENKIYSDNNFWLKEMEAFDGKRRSGELGHDDVVDCVSSAFACLVKQRTMPSFSVPIYTKQNDFAIN